jgi:hypothetical protein
MVAGGSATWDSVEGKPVTFPPATHTQDIASVTGLQTALDGKLTQAVADTLYAPSGASGSSVVAQVDFGANGDYAEASVAATWVVAASRIVVSPAIPTTSDHDPEDALIECLSAGVVAINPGVGFTVGASAPFGTWGRYDFNCIGV